MRSDCDKIKRRVWTKWKYMMTRGSSLKVPKVGMCRTAISFLFISFYIWITTMLISDFVIFCLFWNYSIVLICFFFLFLSVFVKLHSFCSLFDFHYEIGSYFYSQQIWNALKSNYAFLVHAQSLEITFRYMFNSDKRSCTFFLHVHNRNKHKIVHYGQNKAHSAQRVIRIHKRIQKLPKIIRNPAPTSICFQKFLLSPIKNFGTIRIHIPNFHRW